MTHAGGDRRDYVGISSVNSDEKSGRRKPKVSWGRDILPGLVGPKMRPKGVIDGQLVNIPALFNFFKFLKAFGKVEYRDI